MAEIVGIGMASVACDVGAELVFNTNLSDIKNLFNDVETKLAELNSSNMAIKEFLENGLYRDVQASLKLLESDKQFLDSCMKSMNRINFPKSEEAKLKDYVHEIELLLQKNISILDKHYLKKTTRTLYKVCAGFHFIEYHVAPAAEQVLKIEAKGFKAILKKIQSKSIDATFVWSLSGDKIGLSGFDDGRDGNYVRVNLSDYKSKIDESKKITTISEFYEHYWRYKTNHVDRVWYDEDEDVIYRKIQLDELMKKGRNSFYQSIARFEQKYIYPEFYKEVHDLYENMKNEVNQDAGELQSNFKELRDYISKLYRTIQLHVARLGVATD